MGGGLSDDNFFSGDGRLKCETRNFFVWKPSALLKYPGLLLPCTLLGGLLGTVLLGDCSLLPELPVSLNPGGVKF